MLIKNLNNEERFGILKGTVGEIAEVVGALPAFKTFENSTLQQGNTMDQSQRDAQSACAMSTADRSLPA